MLYVKRKNLFEVFFEKRHSLIIQFNNGDLTKKEFLQENFNFITSLNIKPFIKIDSFEKGMFNYQYYNSLAKLSDACKRDKKYKQAQKVLCRVQKHWAKFVSSKRFNDYKHTKAG